MWGKYGSLVLVAFLGLPSNGARACSYDLPGVLEAIGQADIIAFGVVDSILVDEWGIIQSAVFIPDKVLKGIANGRLQLHGSSLANSPCAGDAVRPYEPGERVMMMLTDEGSGSYEPPLFLPMLMQFRGNDREDEELLSIYLTTAMSGGVDPVEVRLSCQPQYAVGDEVVVLARVTNRLSVPIIFTLNKEFSSDIPVVRFNVSRTDHDYLSPGGGFWVVPAKGSREIPILLQEYFGSLGEDTYLAWAYVDVVRHYWDYVGSESSLDFSVTTSTVAKEWSWGKLKKVYWEK